MSQDFNYWLFWFLKHPENWRNRGLTNKHVTALKTPLHQKMLEFLLPTSLRDETAEL